MTAQKNLARATLTLALVSLGTLATSSALAATSDYDDSTHKVADDRQSPLSPTAIEATLAIAGGDAYGLGLGARLSHTLEGGVFLGAAYTHYLGSRVEVFGLETAWSADKVMLEGGYEFWWGKVGLRPYAGLGMVWVRSSMSTSNVLGEGEVLSDYSDNALALALGAQFTYAMNDSVYVGADGHFLSAFADETDASLQIAGRIGTSF